MRAVDVVVIGSGPGGMTAALALARRGLQVLVLEQHYLPGGWTHSFTLEGYRFSPGVHYLGDLLPGQRLRKLFEGLRLGELTFFELNPQGIDHVLVGGEQFDVPKGLALFQQQLTARFPHQRLGIARYFEVLSRLAADVRRSRQLFAFPAVLALPLRAPTMARWCFSTLSSLLDATISDPLLKGLLAARCGNNGLPPSQVSLPFHAAMENYYFGGAYYPKGGAKALSSAWVKALRRHGGRIRMKSRVAKILLEGDRASGVELEGGEQIRARWVVSNADPAITYLSLLPRGAAPKEQKRAQRVRMSAGSLSLFAATDLDLRESGHDGGNYWWYHTTDLEGVYQRMQNIVPTDDVEGLFLSIPTLKDPTLRADRHHTLEMFTFVPYDFFARWKNDPSGRRSPEYRALKQSLIDRMVAAAENVIPGLQRRLVFAELGTPLTNDHYCATNRGAVYGSAKIPRQTGLFAPRIASSIEGLLLCGASLLNHGVGGAAMSGLLAAQKILGGELDELLEPEDGSIRIEPALA